MSIKINFEKYVPVPEGIYPGTIVAIDLDDTSEYGSQLKFKFMLDPFEGYTSGKELSTWASAKFTPKSKLYRWAESIMGKLPEGYNFDSDDFLNKKVFVIVDHRAGNDGQVYDKVSGIKPIRTPKTAAQLNAELAALEVESPF